MATPFITDTEATQKIQQSYNQLDNLKTDKGGYEGTAQDLKDEIDEIDGLTQYLELTPSAIFSKRGSNLIETPNRDIILSVDSTQANRILGTNYLRGIWGGYDNEINANLASNIFGSHHSIIRLGATHALIVGGSVLINEGGYTAMVGGTGNTLKGDFSAIIAGQDNTSNGGFSSIISSKNCIIEEGTGDYSLIFNSQDSEIEGTLFMSIFGGLRNKITSGSWASILNGRDNIVANNFASILSGDINKALGVFSSVLNGYGCEALGNNSTVINGRGAKAHSFAEVVMGLYPTDYTPESSSALVRADRILTVGVGTSSSPRDGMILNKSGDLYLWGNLKTSYLKIQGTSNLATPENGDLWIYNNVLRVRLNAVNETLVTESALRNTARTFTAVQTFTASPIVPIPSSSTQAAPKGYVDGKSITNTSLTVSQTASDLNTLYPTATDGLEVKCPNITPPTIYKKTSVTGQWMVVEATVLNP